MRVCMLLFPIYRVLWGLGDFSWLLANEGWAVMRISMGSRRWND